jgi:Ca2+/Na+ antiporter
MLEQELKNIWKNSSKTEQIKFETSRLMIDLDKKMKRFEKTIRYRDMREIGSSVLGILLFGYFVFAIPFLLTKIASFFTVIWFAYVIYKFRAAKKHKSPANFSLSFREQLKQQKGNMIRQARLLDTVLYWYLLPPFILNVIFIMGLGSPTDFNWSNSIANQLLPLSMMSKIAYLLFVAVLYAGILWLNKRAVKKEINPVIKDIERVLEQLERED